MSEIRMIGKQDFFIWANLYELVCERHIIYLRFYAIYQSNESYLIAITVILNNQSEQQRVLINLMNNNFTDESEYKSFHIIMSKSQHKGHLILGDFNSATDEQMLSQNQVKTIITAARGFEHLSIPNTYTHIVFPLADVKSENILAYFDQSNQIIQENLKRGGVLVHCGAGVSRFQSAALVIAYYMKTNKQTFKNAFKFVKNIRPAVCPNLGFELQLKKYETELGLTLQIPKLQKKYKSNLQSNRKTANMPDFRESHDGNQSNHSKAVQNKSVFIFDPNFNSLSSYKKNEKKVISRQYAKSRPKQHTTNNFKKFYQVAQTKLFVTGRATGKNSGDIQGSQKDLHSNLDFGDIGVRNNSGVYGRAGSKNSQNKQKNPLLGTWGPMAHKKYRLDM